MCMILQLVIQALTLIGGHEAVLPTLHRYATKLMESSLLAAAACCADAILRPPQQRSCLIQGNSPPRLLHLSSACRAVQEFQSSRASAAAVCQLSQLFSSISIQAEQVGACRGVDQHTCCATFAAHTVLCLLQHCLCHHASSSPSMPHSCAQLRRQHDVQHHMSHCT